MKKSSKLKFVLFFILTVLLFSIFLNTNIYAASIVMSISKNTAYVGDTFIVTISGINGKVNISSNSNISIDKSGSQWVDGSLIINGTAKSVGTGTITVTPVDVTTTAAEPEVVTASASRSITITEKKAVTTTKAPATKKPTTSTPKPKPTPVEDNYYIAELTVKGVKGDGEAIDIPLSPEFNKDVFEYTCNVSSDIQRIGIDKNAGKYTDSIVIEGLEELKPGENIISLTLKAEDHEPKTYTIKVTKEAETFVDETVAEPTDEPKVENKKDTSMITMPVWSFVLLQVIIIVIEVIGFRIISIKKTKKY